MININHSDCVKWCIEYRAKHDAEPEKYPLFDSCCTDPPYELGFMGKKWDNTGVAFAPETWKAIFNILKDGAHIVAFSGTRTYHRMAVAIEDAGFEIRDQLAWIYGSGFPKSHDISKAIDKAAGVVREVVGEQKLTGKARILAGNYNGSYKSEYKEYEYKEKINITAPASQAAKQWDGWGTALKPAFEPILYATKRFDTVPNASIVVEFTTIIEALLWSMSSVKFAKEVSKSSLPECGVLECDTVRWIAAALYTIESLKKSDVMDMFKSQEEGLTFLSIGKLWSAILDALCTTENRFTTEMVTSLTTGLRTLRSWILQIIPENITQAAFSQNGLWLNVNNAEKELNAVHLNWSGIPTHSATEHVGQNTSNAILNAIAEIAASCSLLPLATIENIVQAPAPIKTTIKSDKKEKIANVTNVARILNLPKDSILNIVEESVWPPRFASPNANPICLARKPISEKNIAANVLKHGTGAININACRIGTEEVIKATRNYVAGGLEPGGLDKSPDKIFTEYKQNDKGRFPANIIHDGSDEVLAGFPMQKSGEVKPVIGAKKPSVALGDYKVGNPNHFTSSEGSAARFFYSAKAGPLDRLGSKHPTIKPIDLMRWLCRLITPVGGHILEPFAGSGSTGIAAMADGFDCTMIDIEADHVADIERKIAHLKGEGQSSINMHKERKAEKLDKLGGLFE